jgi:NRPS condensation-like uncharacterized protein
MKRVSLANLAVNAPTIDTAPPPAVRDRARPNMKSVTQSQASELTSDQASKLDGRIQVNFRMDKDGYKELRRMALDEDTTVNDLILQALNNLRQQKGLKALR